MSDTAIRPVAEVLSDFVGRFRPEAAQGLRVVYQLDLTGDEGGVWHLTIAQQECKLSTGPAPRADCSFTVAAADWRELVAGRLDALTAFFSGQIQVQGDLSLAARLESMFAF